jgi:DNA-binding PadR family transcriptional regulator
MEKEGLIKTVKEKRKTRGRPRTIIRATSLGRDFRKTYQELELMPLRSTKTDLIRARKDAEYVKRLVSRGKSPHELFLELNSIVKRNK